MVLQPLVTFCKVEDEDGNDITPSEEIRLQIMKLLIQYGCDINSQDSSGFTFLHHSIQDGHVEAVKLLLDNGARVDIANEDDITPIKCLGIRRLDENHNDISPPDDKILKIIELFAERKIGVKTYHLQLHDKLNKFKAILLSKC